MLLSLIVLLILPTYAEAQNLLLSSTTKIAAHQTKKSGVAFVLSEKLPYQEQLPELIKGADIPIPGYLYEGKLPNGAGQYDGLPSCQRDRVHYLARSEEEEKFLSLDVVVYQFNDTEQKKKADGFGYKAVPYIEGALANPYRPQGDVAQTIIRILALECLPVRVRSIKKNGNNYFEYREGKKAFLSTEK